MNNKRKVESFLSDGLYRELERTEKEYGLTKAEIMRRSLQKYLIEINNFKEINVTLNNAGDSLKQFGMDLFHISKLTNQSFNNVSNVAIEFSKQGLEIGETLKRTKLALILCRISGIEAKESVECLTSCINNFSDNLDSTEIINKLAKIDCNYVVSMKDLAEALKKCSTSSQEAKVSFEELLSLITKVKIRTGASGQYIGNSMKILMNRLGRAETRKAIQSIVQNENVSGIDLLIELSKIWKGLDEQPKQEVVEILGGIRFLNLLLNDLSNKNGIYYEVLKLLNDKDNYE